jgi:Uma2 family endonuclease
MNLAFSESKLPVRLRFDRPVTDDELMRLSVENEPMRFERNAIGEIIVMSPVGIDGGGIETDVTTELSNWARADGRGKAFGATTGFKLPDSSVRSADSAWVSWQRLNSVSREQREGFGPICPEFIIEVRSKSDRLPPLQAKMGEWIANGVAVAWLIDPLEKAVTIYRPGEQPELLAQPTSVQGTGPIAGFELVLARIWS